MTKLFRTQGWMTVAQLAGAWSPELAEGGEDPKQCEQNLVHILMEDKRVRWRGKSEPHSA
jgi:hypothetical protein